MDKLASFYKEVCAMSPNFMQGMKPKLMEKAKCPQCGKHFTNKKGVKQHIMRIHVQKPKRIVEEKMSNQVVITLEEETVPGTPLFNDELLGSPVNIDAVVESFKVIKIPALNKEMHSPLAK